MNVVIIEDEYPASERLQKLIEKIDGSIRIVAVLENVEMAKKWFAQNEKIDLIFSDIQLSDGLSFEIFSIFPVHSPIVFTTSYDEYAMKAFKVKSIDYLLKPIKVTELEQALEKYRSFKKGFAGDDYSLKVESLMDHLQISGKKYKTRLLVKYQDQLVPISHEEIAYFYTTNELVCLVGNDGRQYLIDYTLEELEKLFDPVCFFRLNRQFIARISSIRKIHTYFNGKLKLELSPSIDQEVIVSREKAGVFKGWVEG